jgi:putative PEP-CTERM system histidine kinase
MIVLLLPFAAAAFSVLLALASLLRKKPTPATWWFFGGMLALAADSLSSGLALRANNPVDVDYWLTSGFIVKSFVPAAWLGFSLTFSRGDYRARLRRLWIPLVAAGAVPTALAVVFRERLYRWVTDGASGEVLLQASEFTRALHVLLLLTLVFALMNLEQTFRAAVGMSRWRIKFVVLGLVFVLGARIYARAQAILFASPDLTQWGVESGGLFVGCLFLSVAYARTGLAEIDVYPSLAVLRSSLTVLLVGGYLLIVGILAQIASRFGGAESFHVQELVVLFGVAGLALLLLSDRARQRIHLFAVRHFSKPRHDSLRIWTRFSQRLATVRDLQDLGVASVKLVSETFDVLSVTVWLFDRESGELKAAASTAPHAAGVPGRPAESISNAGAGLASYPGPFDLEDVDAPWATELRRLNPTTFPNGGQRWCVPLRTAEVGIGIFVLADRVSGAPYTSEELELLQCIGDHITSVVLNLRLASEVADAREVGAFHTMSTFFVHDLKNAAASLNLMLKNFPIHFDDPEFRADALRGIGNTTRRIEDMIGRLSGFRQQSSLTRVDTDLNQLVISALDGIELTPDIELSRELQPLPRIAVDREQIKSVVTNLVINAREATGSGGRIRIRSEHQSGRIVLAVTDTGTGMSPSFMQERLFRPFQSTKKHGLGIGLFQCRAIVQAHGGTIHVASEPGKGTTFTVTLPA